MQRLLDLVQKTSAYLAERGIANARREAEWLFSETLGLSRIELYTRFDMPIDTAEADRLRDRVMRRGRREPLAYVLGNQPFHGLRLEVTPDVLVPRPETEELVDLCLADLPPGPVRILDVGTGSGAIALALKQARPQAEVQATEASPAALAVAQANAVRLGLEIVFHQTDLTQGLAGGWDLVVANLPYVGESERPLCDPELAFEPAMALFAAEGGLALIRNLLGQARHLLAPDGRMWLEHGFQQGERICSLGQQAGLAVTIHRDGSGQERFARMQLVHPDPALRDQATPA